MFFKRKNPRVKNYKPVRKRRDYSNLPFRLLRLYSILLIALPLAVGWFYMQRNGTPHVLYEYSYYGSPENPHHTSCTYIGFYGKKERLVYGCPLITLLKS